MFTEKVLENIIAMDDNAFNAALEGLTDAEIDQLCDALEALSSNDKKSLKSFGNGIGSGATKAPEQDRNHEAIYNAAMNKVNSYEGADKTRALKALRSGIKKSIGGNIFTRGKKADEVMRNMQQSSDFHKAQDKTKELNQKLQDKINSIKTPAPTAKECTTESASEYDSLESILEAFLEMSDEIREAAIESLSEDETNMILDYIDTTAAIESIFNALAEMDDETLDATLESFSESELNFLAANESLIKSRYERAQDKIAKVQAQQKSNPTEKTDKAIDAISKVNNALHQDVGSIASNAAFNIKKKLAGAKANMTAANNSTHNEILRKIAEANKRGAELSRA